MSNSSAGERQDPRLMLGPQGEIRKCSFTVHPIEMGSTTALSYVVVGAAAFKWLPKRLEADGFPMALLPEMDKKGELRFKGRLYKSSDYKDYGHPLLYLILDIRVDELPTFDMRRLHECLHDECKSADVVNFTVIHLASKEVLMHPQYEGFVRRMEDV